MIVAVAGTHAAIWYLFSDPRLGKAASDRLTRKTLHDGRALLCGLSIVINYLAGPVPDLAPIQPTLGSRAPESCGRKQLDSLSGLTGWGVGKIAACARDVLRPLVGMPANVLLIATGMADD